MRLGLGIDTGGTHTDSAIVDLDTGIVLFRSKALTTHGNLSDGIFASVSNIDGATLRAVSLVSLSSTLATNSVVEGKGGRTGLLAIGTPYRGSAGPECYAELGGRYDLSGNEVEELDPDEVSEALETMRGKVDAVAVAGYLSVRNPGHENAVRDLAHTILDVPVVCGHDLSSKLGFVQRADTAVMNARLIPVVSDLVGSVKASLARLGVDAPLMIVKGDGSVMGEGSAVERPVETILSGPASSMIGARAMTGLRDAVVVDIGGTTTDIGMIRNGSVRIDPEGAMVGGRRTRVRAVDVSTYGIGGDSRILVNGRETVISSTHTIPLCVAASLWPCVMDRLRELENVTDDRSADVSDTGDVCQDTEFFVSAGALVAADLRGSDRLLAEMASEGPVSLREAGARASVPVHSFSVSRMESLGLISRIGVTPTDILHAEGGYTKYDPEASRIAVSYLARKSGVTEEEFISRTKAIVASRIASCIMDDVMREELGAEELDEVHKAMISELLSHRGGVYSLSMRLGVPIIGIGAPAGSWLRTVADMLGTELVVPENSDVGNAVGAVTGSISETATVMVRARQDDRSKDPGCIVFTGDGKRDFPDPESAITYAGEEARKSALVKAVRAGTADPVVDLRVEKILSDITGDGEQSFREASVTATATGRPKTQSEYEL